MGDQAHEWTEFTGYAFHVRRRLTTEEQTSIGEVKDCRHTEEFNQRLQACWMVLPHRAKLLAAQENQ